jgi:hypothetical protein
MLNPAQLRMEQNWPQPIQPSNFFFISSAEKKACARHGNLSIFEKPVTGFYGLLLHAFLVDVLTYSWTSKFSGAPTFVSELTPN